jgi:hypothetical protein
MKSLEETIAVLSAKLLSLAPGPLAELRRMEPDGVGASMFWRLVRAHNGDPHAQVRTEFIGSPA